MASLKRAITLIPRSMSTLKDVEASAGVVPGSSSISTTDKPATCTATTSDDATWDEGDGHANPYNWPTSRKIITGIVCSSSQLITTMSAAMVVPALDQILEGLHVDRFNGQIAFSVFFLGLGLAPFVVAPLSEIYGRRPIWLAGNAFYILWNSLCPVGNSLGLMVTGRFLSACGASVGITLTGPIMADLYRAEDRGKAVAIAGMLPYIGPALGPIIGGLAAQHLRWPWLFWILSISDAVSLIVGFFLLQETYAPVLLKRKAEAQSKSRANENSTDQTQILNKGQSPVQQFLSVFLPAFKNSLRLLFYRRVIQVTALMLALDFGIYTLVLGSFATLWQEEYHQSPSTASLHYIAIAVGAILSAQVGGIAMDFSWRRMRARYPDQNPTPEYRIPYLMLTILPATAGLLLYAWAAENHFHWVVVDLGVLLFTWTSFMLTGALNAYLFDEFPQKFSASAGAAARVGTYSFGFAFPIFAPALYDALGYGWGNTFLSLLFATSGGLIAFALWRWGPQIRASGRVDKEAKEEQT